MKRGLRLSTQATAYHEAGRAVAAHVLGQWKALSGNFHKPSASEGAHINGPPEGFCHSFAPPYHVNETGRIRGRCFHDNASRWAQQHYGFSEACPPISRSG
jgi:hypothetical protein